MKHRVLRALLTAAVMVAAFSTSAFAQGGATASSIIGTVSDPSGAVIPGASVTVKNNATQTQYTATTTEQGGFTIPSVDPGTYTVTVTLMGFKTAVVNDVRVSAGQPASVRVTLAVGGLEETVVVAGGSEIIQTQSAAVVNTIDTNQILKLPTGSRSALNFVTSLPGVNTPSSDSRQSTINGLPQSAINITIDGLSAQDNHLKTGDGFFARVSPRLDAIEEVTVSTAAQDAANTGQGAIQIKFVTRSGSNDFSGSSYYYLQHHKLDSNTWFNNRDLPPDPATGKAPKNQDVLYQPGTRVGGPIVIPGLWNGRNKAFFFVNYEESRSPGQNTANRTILHPRAMDGFFRYNVGGQVREVNVYAVAAANGHVATPDPTIAGLFGDIRAAVASQGGLVDETDPLIQRYTYQFDSDSVTRYPTGRVDVNLTDKHRLSGSINYTDLVSTPDTTNDGEPVFPGFPVTYSQVSDRYIVQGTLRSTLTQNLVNEFKVGGSGGATLFGPEKSVAQHTSAIANTAGFGLDINNNIDISNPANLAAYSAREATTRILENTLSWLKGNHNVQAGFAFTQAQVWLHNRQFVPTVTFGVSSEDSAQGIFNGTTFPGATNAQLIDARDLYAILTGRVLSIAAEARLDETNDEYRYLGLGVQRARLRDYGFFIADTWRWRPNVTFNIGLRYELQQPFYPLNNSYSKATIEDVCGVSGAATPGSCNIFQPGVQPGRIPQFIQYNKGEGAYNTDRNNFAPNLGIAWTMGGNSGLLGAVLGRAEGDSVLRGGYTLGYNRPGTSDFTGTIDDNPGISITANRNHTIGNLGTPGTLFFRNPGSLGPPSDLPTRRNYPMTDVITGDIMTFDPNLQVPYAQTWTAGWQRKLTGDLAVEARYVGTRSLNSWQTYDYNEVNIYENNFINEFRNAQNNLQANLAAGRGATFGFTGAPGTVPLPIFLAYFSGRDASQAANSALYTSSNFTSATFRDHLAMHYPNPFAAATALDNDATRRQNALNAGLPANFLVANPNYLGGAEVIGNGGYTKYNSMQLELRKRLSHGLQFNANYVFGRAYGSNRYTLRRDRVKNLQSGTEGGVDHAFKGSWTYELPFGQGRRFASGAGAWMERLIGGWSFDGIARIQSGRLVNFGNVRLVGMSFDEFKDAFKLRFDHENKLIYMLPQDIIDNTVKAHQVSATSLTGYGDQGAPSGRYLAPANGPDCIEPDSGIDFGDCGTNTLIVTGPKLVRFDLSAVKRLPIKGRVNFEFRAEFLNAFNTPWFNPVTGTGGTLNDDNGGNNPDDFEVTSASSGRTIQLVWRVNW